MTIPAKRIFPAMAAALFLALGSLNPAAAEEQFSDAKLTAFLSANAEVRETAREWNPRIKKAENEEEKAKLVGQARADMAKAIKQTPDITVAEYGEILQAARGDEALAGRLNEMVAELQGE